jgi:hypothetical protein
MDSEDEGAELINMTLDFDEPEEVNRVQLGSHTHHLKHGGRRRVPESDQQRHEDRPAWRRQSPYPHQDEPTYGLTERLKAWFMGVPRDPNAQFQIEGTDVNVANVSLFAHHESSLDESMSWQYMFTLGMLGLATVFAFLGTLVVAGIVNSYSNGAVFLVVAIGSSLLVVLVFGALLMDWTRCTPYSHHHTNAVFFPNAYFIICMLFAMIALGYWTSTYPSSFFATYDAAAAPAEVRPFYYAVWTLFTCMCITPVPWLVSSLSAQLHPERKLSLNKSDTRSRLYYATDDHSVGREVQLSPDQ